MTHSLFLYRRFFLSLSLFCIGMIFFWMASPFWKSENTGGDTLWIVDNSLSMGVEDMGISIDGAIQSRLDRARSLILDGMAKISGHHGALVFARSAAVVLPMSPVTEWGKKNIENIALVTDNGGSDISAVFSLLFSLYSERVTPLHVILISDGGDTSTTSLPPLPSHTDLTIIGIWTLTGWPIPLGYDALGRRRYKIYDNREVIVPYEEKNIEKLTRNYAAKVYTFSTADMWTEILSKLIPERVDPEVWYSRMFFSIGVIWILLSILIHPYIYVKSRE